MPVRACTRLGRMDAFGAQCTAASCNARDIEILPCGIRFAAQQSLQAHTLCQIITKVQADTP